MREPAADSTDYTDVLIRVIRGCFSRNQKAYLNANCMILASAEVVIWPNVLLLRVVKPEGRVPGRKLFVTLNASARNSSF